MTSHRICSDDHCKKKENARTLDFVATKKISKFDAGLKRKCKRKKYMTQRIVNIPHVTLNGITQSVKLYMFLDTKKTDFV